MKVQCLKKKRKLTRQSPSSKTKAELADEERKNWSEYIYIYIYIGTVRTEDWSFGGWQAAVPVLKVYKRRQNNQVPKLKLNQLMTKEKIGQNFLYLFIFSDCKDRGLEFWGLVGSSTSAESISKKPKQMNKK